MRQGRFGERIAQRRDSKFLLQRQSRDRRALERPPGRHGCSFRERLPLIAAFKEHDEFYGAVFARLQEVKYTAQQWPRMD